MTPYLETFPENVRWLRCGPHPGPSDAFEAFKSIMERRVRREFAVEHKNNVAIVWPTARVEWHGQTVYASAEVANG